MTWKLVRKIADFGMILFWIAIVGLALITIAGCSVPDPRIDTLEQNVAGLQATQVEMAAAIAVSDSKIDEALSAAEMAGETAMFAIERAGDAYILAQANEAAIAAFVDPLIAYPVTAHLYIGGEGMTTVQARANAWVDHDSFLLGGRFYYYGEATNIGELQNGGVYMIVPAIQPNTFARAAIGTCFIESGDRDSQWQLAARWIEIKDVPGIRWGIACLEDAEHGDGGMYWHKDATGNVPTGNVTWARTGTKVWVEIGYPLRVETP